MASHERAHSAMGGGKSKSHGKPHSVHVKRAHSGGFIATHHHKAAEGEMTPEPEDHVIPDQDALMQHMQSNLGDQPPAAPAPEPAPAAPAGGAAPAAPGM